MRRSFLRAAAATGAAATASSLIGFRAWASTSLWKQPGATDASVADQIHLQYGADAAAEMTVSWHTGTSVSRPRLRLGTPRGGWGLDIPAETRSYVDGINGIETICQHARATRLAPDTTYIYEVLADGTTPVQGAFSTAPRGRVPFRFTAVASGSEIGTWSAVRDPDTVHPLGHRHVRPRPGRPPRRADLDQRELLPHPGRHHGDAVPRSRPVRQLHDEQVPPGRRAARHRPARADSGAWLTPRQ